MPIRLNLLAEAQAEEEMRRKDPVKRGIWAGGALVACVLAYYIVLLIFTFTKRAELSRIEGRMENGNSHYQQIADNDKKRKDNLSKLGSLRQFATRRFLWGNVMNAMQKSALDDVQLVRFHAEQGYTVTEEVKGKTTDSGRTTIGKPGFVTERISLTFDAKDNSATPGDRINKYKATLENAAFVMKDPSSTNSTKQTVTLKNLAAPSFDAESGKTVVLFSLECRLPEKPIISK